MGIVVFGLWAGGAYLAILMWRQMVLRVDHPRGYWVGVVLIILSPQLYFLAYGIVDWVRWHKQCDAIRLVIPPAIRTDVLGLDASEVNLYGLKYGAVSRYVMVYQTGNVELGVLRSNCTLDDALREVSERKGIACYEMQSTAMGLPEYRLAGSSSVLPSTQWFSISHVRYELRRWTEVVGVWEEYFLTRRSENFVNFLIAPDSLVCRSGDISAMDWVRASIETGVRNGSDN